MEKVDLAIETTPNTEESSPTPLRGVWLILVRTAWVTIVVLMLLMYIRGFPLHISQLYKVDDGWGLNRQRVEALQSIGLSLAFRAGYFITIELVTGLTFLFIAVFIFWRKSSDWVVILVSLLLITYANTELPFISALERSSKLWEWLVNLVQAIGEVLSLIVFYFFPTGRFVPRWTRPLAFIYTGLVLLWLLNPDLKFNMVYGKTFDETPEMSLLVALAWHVTSLYALIYRYRHTANLVLRQQMKWVVFGLTVAFMASAVRFTIAIIVGKLELFQDPLARVIYDMILRPTQWILLTSVPICFGIAILRYRLWNVDIVINRTLLYGALTASVIGIYIFIVGSLSLLFQSQYNNILISLIGTGFIAALFQPLRNQLQRMVNRILYANRRDPYTAISYLSQQLGVEMAPKDVLPTVTQTISESLQLPYVAIALAENNSQQTEISSTSLQDFKIVAQYGMLATGFNNLEGLPLIYQGVTIGQLLIATRPGDGKLSKEDKHLLTTVAKQASITAHSVQLMTELQKAREKLVITLEEERQRLHFELHDVLGPQLASQNLFLQTALKELRQNPEFATKLINDSIDNVKTAVTNLRQVINNLRPPLLDELGLTDALREQTNQYQASGVYFTFDMPEFLPPLSAAIEVACYHIVQEAITNVIRHANASTCIIKLTVSDLLYLEVCDDGCKKIQNYLPGVGLTSMRTRAEELFGTFRITPNSPQGTCVQVQIPLS